MFKERILIGIIAVILGIFLTGGAFYLWQATKVIPAPQISLKSDQPMPSPAPLLIVSNPQDESVVDKRIIQVAGTALHAKSLIVSTTTQDIVLNPATDGAFSTNVTISEGVNQIEILAIMDSGEVLKEDRTVTFTTETF